MIRFTMLSTIALTLVSGITAIGQAGPPTRLNEGKNWVPKIPGGTIQAPIRLEIASKATLSGNTWGTSSTSVYGQSGGQAQSIRLRYFAGQAKVPSFKPITIEASADQGFKEIYRSKSFTPGHGVMEVSKGLALVPIPGPGDYVTGVTKWYLRAKASDGGISNSVVVNFPASGKH